MDHWHILRNGFDPIQMHSLETVFTIGNGYLGTRGSFEEGYPGEKSATLINGLYDEVPLVFTELVNTPNWIDLQIIAAGSRLNLKTAEIRQFVRDLNLQNGELTRSFQWLIPGNGVLFLEFKRFASLADEHLMALACRVKSVDFSGEIEFQSGLPGYVDNDGFVHLSCEDQGSWGDQTGFLQLSTRKSAITLAEAFLFRLTAGEAPHSKGMNCPWYPSRSIHTILEPGGEVQVEKIVTVFTSLDVANPLCSVKEKLEQVQSRGYQDLLSESATVWRQEWQTSNIDIEGDDQADLEFRFALFQILIAAPRSNEHVSIPAKSLSGFGYHGHVFWDTEVFVMPFLTYTQPQIARRLLMYRYHTLPAARLKARANHAEGAQFAWESAATGEENTPRWVPLPDGNLVRIWCGDIEYHISSDIAYAIYQYWRVTGDDEFMRNYGAEIVLETARFWNSIASWNSERNCFEIKDVIGPDENHDHIDNNAYTNNFARWNLQAGIEILGWLEDSSPEKARELKENLELTSQNLEHWHRVIDHLYLGYDPESGLYEQFQGFFKLERVDLSQYEPRNQSIQALLGIERTQQCQILKQPDVVMMLYLLSLPDEDGLYRRNYEYYTPVTDFSYGSSLGSPIQAIMAARMGDMQKAYELFRFSAGTDLEDIRGNSSDGIHVATYGGLWQSIIFGFAGLQHSPEGMTIQPNLPGGWKCLRFHILYRGRKYKVEIQPTNHTVQWEPLPIRAAIFDLDGVLTDTSELHYRAWKRLAEEEQIPFTRAENEALRGIPRRESLLLLLKGRKVSEEKLEEMMERKNRYYVESIATLSPKDLLPGARELLEECHSAGWSIAVGSASKNARAVIEKLGISSLLDVVTDGSSVSRQKPAPDLFLQAAALLNVLPAQCLVFEDATAGIEAATAAGMISIGIGDESRVGKATLIFPDLSAVSLKKLQDILFGISGENE